MSGAGKRTDYGRAWREAWRIVWGGRKRLAAGLALLTVDRLAAFVMPVTAKFLIDDVMGQGRAELLPWLVLAALAASTLQSGTTFALARVLGVAAQRTIAEMRESVHERVIRLPTRYFDNKASGRLVSRIMSDPSGVRNLIGTGMVQLGGGVLTLLLALGILFWLNTAMTLVLLAVVAVHLVLMGLVFNRLRPLFRKRAELNAKVMGRLTEALGAIRIVKAFHSEGYEDRVFSKGVRDLCEVVVKGVTGVAGTMAATHFIFGVAGAALTWMGGMAVLGGEMTLGEFALYVFFTAMAVQPMMQIANVGTQISEALAGLDRIQEIRGEATEQERDSAFRPVPEVGGEVAFRDVWFEYEQGQPVLRGVSFRAAAGATVALVGPSGAGKTTLANLILAFAYPNRGTIEVDGRDLSRLRLAEYRRHLAVVLQENVLFDGTVAENIAYSRPEAAREEVLQAGRAAHCDEFAQRLEKGYDTVVGERGVKLSGGQRQRVAIARAILADPRILILDEATSSLDSESEARIQAALRALRRGRTTFVIAHRLSTIRSADQILVMDRGEIVERGTHAQLLALGGLYRELHDRQYRFEHERFINPGEDFTPLPEAPDAAREPVAADGGMRLE